MSNETKADWKIIDPAKLQPEVAKAYEAYKASYAAMKAKRDTFENAVRKSIKVQPGNRIAISYNFGKLNMAEVADTARSTTSRKAVSLEEAFSQAA